MDVSFSDFEQKAADRFRDLFNVAWARGVAALAVSLTTLWVVAGIGPTLREKHPVIPRPLTWWQDQLAQMGVQYPHWLRVVASWHAPSHASAVLGGLCACALAASLAAGRVNAPGYELGGLLSLTLSAQWFGLGRTLTWFAGFVGILVAVALVLALRDYARNRLDYVRWSEREGVEYSFTSIGVGLMKGPVVLVASPLIYPFARVFAAVRFFGEDHDQELIPRESLALDQIVRDAERHKWSVADLPAGTLLRAIVALQASGRSTRTARWNRSLLLTPRATGAVEVLPALLNEAW